MSNIPVSAIFRFLTGAILLPNHSKFLFVCLFVFLNVRLHLLTPVWILRCFKNSSSILTWSICKQYQTNWNRIWSLCPFFAMLYTYLDLKTKLYEISVILSFVGILFHDDSSFLFRSYTFWKKPWCFHTFIVTFNRLEWTCSICAVWVNPLLSQISFEWQQGFWIYFIYVRLRHSFAYLRSVILSVDWSTRRLQSWTCSSLPTVAELLKLTQSIVIEIQRQFADLYKVQLCIRRFFCGCPSDLRGEGGRLSPAWWQYSS